MLNKKALIILLIIVVIMIVPGMVFAQAYGTSFTTSVTYQNVGTGDATITVSFYPDSTTTTPINITTDPLPPNASSSLYIGSLSNVSAGFQGSAVIQSDQPIVATMVQLPQGANRGTNNRPLANGFSQGSEKVLIATVLKNTYNTNTVFSVQNAGSSATDATFKFYDTSANLVYSFTENIQPGAAFYVDAGTLSGLGSSFNGSAVVETTGGEIVGGAMELSSSGAGASSFEGVGSGSQKIYMPSALCSAYGADTAYAVQNTNLTSTATVTVTYSNGVEDTKSIPAGAKGSFVACNAPSMTAGYSGSAVITSDQPVIAIGKAYGSGLSTAFVGIADGASKIALPYVRYASATNWASGSQQRAFLTIQNVGDTDLAAGDVTVKYIDKNGNQVGSTHTLGAIPVGGKLNSSAADAGLSEFGVYSDGSFGGGAIVEGPAGSKLAVVARISTQVAPGQFASEDYNGMPVQ